MLRPGVSLLWVAALSGLVVGPDASASAPMAARLDGVQVPAPLPPLPASPHRPPETVPPQAPVADLQPRDPSSQGWVMAAAHPSAPPSLLYPLPEPAVEVDPYGWRWSDSRQAWRIHAGHDLIAPQGTPVLAMAPGRVVLVEAIDGYGLTVLLDHGNGWQSLYAHLLDSAVQQGDRLQAGDRLGRVGRSGRASTDHLHVELRRRWMDDAPATDRVVAVDLAPLLADALRRLPLQQAQGVSLASP